MRAFVTIFLLITLSIFLNASGFDEPSRVNDQFCYKSYLSGTYKNTKYSDLSDKSNVSDKQIKEKINLLTFFKYKSDKFLIHSSFDIYSTSSDMGDYSYIPTKRSGIILNDIYFQLKLSEKFSIAYGIISFKGGNFSQYGHQDMVYGNGLSTLVDVNVLGIWGIYKTGNLLFKLGHGTWYNNIGNESLYDDFDGSGGYFLTSEYSKQTTKGKLLLEFDYDYVTTKLKNKNLSTINMFGIGGSYEEYKFSTVVYGSISYNINQETPQNVETLYGLPIGYGKPGTYTGQSLLLGVKKYFDFFHQEADIGFEYYTNTKNATAFIIGNFWDDKTYSLYDADAFKVYGDININNKYMFSVMYSHSFERYHNKGISMAESTTNPIIPEYERVQSIMFKLTYKF